MLSSVAADTHHRCPQYLDPAQAPAIPILVRSFIHSSESDPMACVYIGTGFLRLRLSHGLARTAGSAAALATASRPLSLPLPLPVGLSTFRSSSGVPVRLLSTKRRRVVSCAATGLEDAATDGNVITVEDLETMEKYIAESGDKLILVDVSTKTCGPCRLVYPKFVQMSTEYPDAIFLKINGDFNNDTRALMRKWGVRSVPNFRIFRNGVLLHSHVGAKEDELRANFLVHYVQTIAVETSHRNAS